MLERLKYNWIEKLAAVGITLVLLFYVQSVTNPTVQRAFSVPLEFIDKPVNALVRNQDMRVTINVNGEKADVDAVQAGDIHAYVSLRNARLGVQELSIKTRKPETLALVTLIPAEPTVRIDLSQMVSKRLPIRVDWIDQPDGDYSVSSPVHLSPSSATISGWKDQVDGIESLRVQVDLKTAKGNVKEDYPILAFDQSGVQLSSTQLKVTPESSQVQFSLAPLLMSQTLTVIVPSTGQPRYPYSVSDIQWMPKQVIANGERRILGSMTVIRTEPVALDNLTGNLELEKLLIIPKGVVIEGASSVKVSITIKHNGSSPPPPKSTTGTQ
jgi:YbbR domain-containing protein